MHRDRPRLTFGLDDTDGSFQKAFNLDDSDSPLSKFMAEQTTDRTTHEAAMKKLVEEQCGLSEERRGSG